MAIPPPLYRHADDGTAQLRNIVMMSTICRLESQAQRKFAGNTVAVLTSAALAQEGIPRRNVGAVLSLMVAGYEVDMVPISLAKLALRERTNVLFIRSQYVLCATTTWSFDDPLRREDIFCRRIPTQGHDHGRN
jgi:hypothetical protein